MNYQPKDLDRLAKNIMQDLEKDISKSGIFYRIFFRCKDVNSLLKKLNTPGLNGGAKYDGQAKLLRDLIGIRINLYFVDDLKLITDYFKQKFAHQLTEETIDTNTTTEFKPTRVNLIFRIEDRYQTEFKEVIKDPRVDVTFELQLRTVFSEGWHEVEHDLRYKCQNDWGPYPEMSRMFNGFLAALETQEWSMIQLFEQISHAHYKRENTSALIRTKLRIRLESLNLSAEVDQILQDHPILLREIFKTERLLIIQLLLQYPALFPLTMDNVVYFINFHFLQNEAILGMMPEYLRKLFSEYGTKSSTQAKKEPSTITATTQEEV